jgi:hypothetical protein
MKSRGFWGEVVQQAVLGGGLLCLWAGIAGAQQLSVSGSPAAMKITSATAGLPPNDALNTATTYSVKGKANKSYKITVALNANMPAGMTLTIDLVPPAGAVDDGVVTLSTTAREVVGNITNTTTFTGQITYDLAATPAAGVVTSQSRIVTFTLTTWP